MHPSEGLQQPLQGLDALELFELVGVRDCVIATVKIEAVADLQDDLKEVGPLL